MSFFFKNTKKFSIIFTALMLAVTLTAGSLAVAANGLPDDKPQAEAGVVSDVITGGMSFDSATSEPEYDGAAELPVVAMAFNMPQKMNAAYLVPGSDFLKTKDDSADTVKKQIDTALDSFKKYELNTVIIDTVYGEKVIYNTSGADSKFEDFDVTEYITGKCREYGLFVYAIFDASRYDGTEKLDEAASAFAAKYELDGILADGYEGQADQAGYNEYMKSGSSMGYDNFLNQRAATIAKTVSQAVRRAAPDTQAGILAGPVWANVSDSKDGSNTKAEYTSLLSGYADTKRYIELGWFDFVAVKATVGMRDEAAPFSEIAAWWSDLAEKKSIPLYMVYPTGKVGSDGWTSSSIDDQIAFAANENAYRGAMYDSLKNVPGAAVTMAAIAPVPVNSTNTNTAALVKPMPATPAPAPAKPAEPEPEPEPEISESEETDEDLWEDYEDYEDESDEDEWDSGSDEDEYSWLDGILDEDAYFSVSSTAKRIPVQITADQAATYPVSTKNRIPAAAMYPLPKGAVDYTDGKAISITSDGVKYRHIILESGYRVDLTDVKRVDSGPKSNSISSLSLSNKSGYTYVTLKTKQQVTYSINYTGKEFIITFDNTTSVPDTSGLASNPMFSKATWTGKNKLTLTFARASGFMGYKGYYDGGNLVFRFNHPPSSIKTARIFIDPGHGGTDVGGNGKNPLVYEKDITPAIANKLAAELKARGATVKVQDTKTTIRGPARVAEAEKWGADLIISIHCNTAANTNAQGTEVYYFYPFAKQLASNISLNASKHFDTTNRGAKSFIFHVTLSSQVPGVLVETGFMTNKAEYAKLLKSSYHQKLAVGIANGIEGAIKTAYTGKVSNGSEFKSPGTASTSGSGSTTAGGQVTSVSFSEPTMQIKIGETATLKPEYTPTVLKDVPFTWRTSSSSTVSIDENGKITGIKAGTATITATADDGSKERATIRITVLNEVMVTQAPINVSGIALNVASNAEMDKDYVTLYPGNKYRVEVVSDDGRVIRGADFSWKSSKNNIASVDANGVVTAKTVGDTIITATGGGYSLICEIEVSRTKVAVKGVSFAESKVTMIRGTSKALNASVMPKNAADQDIRWSSSNSKIAEVNENGVVTARNSGKVTITARTKSGGYTATCTVEILSKAVPLEEISAYDPELEMRVGTVSFMDIQFYPENATSDLSLTYTSSNAKIVSVDSEGNLKAIAPGKATITAISKADSKLRTTSIITVFS